MAVALLFLIFISFCGVLGIIGWLLTLRYRRRSGASEATCAQWSYITRGLNSFQCPECGADLRGTGIYPPRRQIGLVVAAGLALVFAIPINLCGLVIITMMIKIISSL